MNRKNSINSTKHTIRQLEQMFNDVLNGNLRTRCDADSVDIDFKGVVQSANQLIDTFAGQHEEKRKLEEHIQYDQKMKTIGTLAGGIAHDFNNILTSMFAYCHIVMAQLPVDNPARETMQALQAAIRSAAELVEQILTFSRHEKSDKRTIEINALIFSIVKLLKVTLPENVDINYHVPKEKLFIKAEPSQINQVLLNLCTNAVHAMHETGGRLEISVEKARAGEAGTKPAAENESGVDCCRITISDTGHGMDAGIMARIFEPFFTTKPVSLGNGIGLSMVHGIVLNYGGRIDVTSEPGRGSRFFVYLPLSAAGEKEKASAPAGKPVTVSGEHILFIDDEIEVCNALALILESAGYHVTTISDSRRGASLLEEQWVPYDLVVTDLKMPHMDGIELAALVQRVHPELPVILTTGYSRQSTTIDNIQLGKTGIAAFVKKPFEKDQLIRLIAQVLESSSRSSMH